MTKRFGWNSGRTWSWLDSRKTVPSSEGETLVVDRDDWRHLAWHKEDDEDCLFLPTTSLFICRPKPNPAASATTQPKTGKNNPQMTHQQPETGHADWQCMVGGHHKSVAMVPACKGGKQNDGPYRLIGNNTDMWKKIKHVKIMYILLQCRTVPSKKTSDHW